jgi:hypothetical protein
VKNLCLGTRYGEDAWNFNTSKQLIIEHDMAKYPNLSKEKAPSFNDLQKIYIDVQDNIMNCSILKSKYALHEKIINDYKLSDRAISMLEKANSTIKEQIDKEKCTSPRNGDKIYNYKDLLDSLSYELCGYNMYLYYYEQNIEKNIGILKEGKKIKTIDEWRQVSETEKRIVAQEYDLTRKTMNTALSLYENFEKTYIAHVLLEMIEVELTEDKRFLWGTVRVIQQLVSLWNNAQVHESKQ